MRACFGCESGTLRRGAYGWYCFDCGTYEPTNEADLISDLMFAAIDDGDTDQADRYRAKLDIYKQVTIDSIVEYDAAPPAPTGETVRIKRGLSEDWLEVPLLKATPGWVCVDHDGPLWVMRISEHVHPDDMARLDWRGLPRAE